MASRLVNLRPSQLQLLASLGFQPTLLPSWPCYFWVSADTTILAPGRAACESSASTAPADGHTTPAFRQPRLQQILRPSRTPCLWAFVLNGFSCLEAFGSCDPNILIVLRHGSLWTLRLAARQPPASPNSTAVVALKLISLRPIGLQLLGSLRFRPTSWSSRPCYF